MSRPCSICSHSERLEIDRLLLRGESYRKIAERFGLSMGSISRHREAHIGTDLRDVREVMIQAREEALAEIKGEVKARDMEEIKEEIAAEAKGTTAARLESCATFLDQLRAVRARAANLLDQAEASDDLRSAGIFLRELREQIRLMAELEGKLQSQPQINLQQVNIYQSPAWDAVGLLLARILEPYPDLRAEVAAGLIALQEGRNEP